MEITSMVALILGCFSIMGTVIAVVIFFGKMRWEVDTLKRENGQQESKLDALMESVNVLREKGSVPTETLEKRLGALETKFDKLLEKFQELVIDVKALGKSTTPRRRSQD